MVVLDDLLGNQYRAEFLVTEYYIIGYRVQQQICYLQRILLLSHMLSLVCSIIHSFPEQEIEKETFFLTLHRGLLLFCGEKKINLPSRFRVERERSGLEVQLVTGLEIWVALGYVALTRWELCLSVRSNTVCSILRTD